jgi:tetratricopeptide (TPR) repeat protein
MKGPGSHATVNVNDAETIIRQTLPILEKARRQRPLDLAVSLQNLGYLNAMQQRYSESEALYRRALGVLTQAVGPGDVLIASTLNNLGALYCRQQRYTETETLLHRAFEVRLSTSRPQAVAISQVLAHQAGLLRHLKRKREAKSVEVRVRSIQNAHSRENLENYTVDISALRAARSEFCFGIKHPQLIGTRDCHDDALLALWEHHAFSLETCPLEPPTCRSRRSRYLFAT